MATLAIRGHKTRGKEIIEILEMLGGKNQHSYSADCDSLCFFCGKGNNIIYYDWVNNRCRDEDTTFFTLEDFLEKFPYKVGDKVIFTKYGDNDVVTVESMSWTGTTIEYNYNGGASCLAKDLQPYKEETMEDPKKVMFEANAQCCDIMNHLIKEETMKEKEEKSANHVFDTEIISFDIAQRDKYELDLQGKFKVVLREGVYYVERIKPQYPKNYKECCKVMNYCYNPEPIKIMHKEELIRKFQFLLLYRDAYWKIAGEQMGLGKPWEPDYNEESYEQGSPIKYVIYYTGTCITKGRKCTPSYILTFPTEEIRDAFYENFKSLIEECKELL